MSGTELDKNLNVGDKIVYPKNGLGVIKAIEDRKGQFYLRILITDPEEMDVLVPMANAEKIGIRHLESKENAEKALARLSVAEEDSFKDWKSRLQANQELLYTGELFSIARVISMLYRRSKIKELPTQERKLYEDALSFLADEASYVLGLEKEEMRKRIFMNLECEN